MNLWVEQLTRLFASPRAIPMSGLSGVCSCGREEVMCLFSGSRWDLTHELPQDPGTVLYLFSESASVLLFFFFFFLMS